MGIPQTILNSFQDSGQKNNSADIGRMTGTAPVNGDFVKLRGS